MKVTDETVPEEDLEEAEDAAVVEKRPRRKLFYIESGKRGTLAKIMIGSILALVLPCQHNFQEPSVAHE